MERTSEIQPDDFDHEGEQLLLPTRLPRRDVYSVPERPTPQEETLSWWSRFKQSLWLNTQIAATSLVNSLADSGKVYLLAYGGEDAVAAVTVMAIIEWSPTILGSTFQAVATLTASIYSLDEEHPEEALRPIMLGPSARSSTFDRSLVNHQREDVGQIFRDGMKIVGIYTVPLSFMFGFSGTLLELIRQPTKIVALAQTYCRANMWGIPAYLGGLVCSQLANAVGKAHIVLAFSTLSGIFGNGLGYLLGVHLFGPNMWGVGIGIASQYWIYFGCMLGYFYFSNDPVIQSFQLFRFGGSPRSYFRKILDLGWGISFFYGFELGTLFIAIKWVGEKLGSRVLATQGVIQSWGFLLIVPAYAAGETANIFVSRYRSMGRFTDMISFGRINALIGFIYGTACFLAFEFWPAPLIQVIVGTNNPDLVNASVKVMRWAAPAFLIDPMRIIYSGADRGLERTMMTVVSSVVGLGVVGLSSSYILSYPLNFGLIGSAMGRDLGMLTGLVIMFVAWEYDANQAAGRRLTVRAILNTLCFPCRGERPAYSANSQRFFPLPSSEHSRGVPRRHTNADDLEIERDAIELDNLEEVVIYRAVTEDDIIQQERALI